MTLSKEPRLQVYTSLRMLEVTRDQDTGAVDPSRSSLVSSFQTNEGNSQTSLQGI